MTGEYEDTSSQDGYAQAVAAAQRSYYAGDYELAASKVAACLAQQKTRLMEGLRGAEDSTLLALAGDLGIADLHQEDALRALFMANKAAYYEHPNVESTL